MNVNPIKRNNILIEDITCLDFGVVDIFIKDGIIVEIGKNLGQDLNFDNNQLEIIDGSNLTVLPSFVDMHAHFREPGQEWKEDILSGSHAAVAGGYGAVCCMPNTNPVIDCVPLVEYVLKKANDANLAKIFPIAAITKGQKSQVLSNMRQMRDVGAIAFSDDGKPVSNANIFRNACLYAAADDLLLITHSEDESLSDGGYVNEGLSSSIVGLKGIPRTAEEVGIARELLLAGETGARVHIAHVSTRGSVEIIRFAKSRGIRVTCETCPHYFSATDEEILNFNTNAKINPPLRTDDDVAAIIEGLVDGTIDVIATDHAPHHIDDKKKEFSHASFGTVGLETAFALGMTFLVKPGHLSLRELIKKMSTNPADILKLLDFGRIEVGRPANLTLVDCECEGIFDVENTFSKSKNSLFDGWTLSGKIVYTLVEGRLVFCR